MLLAASWTSFAAAQQQATRPAFAEVFGAPTPEQALDTPIGAKLADRLGRVWHDGADKACMSERKFDAATYRELARNMMLSVGGHMQALALSALDVTKADAAFSTGAGVTAIAELKRLADDPKVKAFLELSRLGKSAEQAETFLENIDRALLLSRYQTTSRASPIATGDDQDLLIEIEDATSAALNYYDANKTPQMIRLFELAMVAADAQTSATNSDTLLTWGPGRLMPILEGPLQQHCIFPK